MAENGMPSSTVLGFTDTAEFFLAPNVTLTIAIIAALGTVLFYYSGQSGT